MKFRSVKYASIVSLVQDGTANLGLILAAKKPYKRDFRGLISLISIPFRALSSPLRWPMCLVLPLFHIDQVNTGLADIVSYIYTNTYQILA